MEKKTRLKKIEIIELESQNKRKCVVCHRIKNLNEFYKHKRSLHGYRRECKLCANKSHNKYISSPKAKQAGLDRSKRYRILHIKEVRNKMYFKNYGITHDEKILLWEKQNRRCSICNIKISNIEKAFIDHNHISGEIRGILCIKCNFGIGSFYDDIKLLQNAINYLSKQ